MFELDQWSLARESRYGALVLSYLYETVTSFNSMAPDEGQSSWGIKFSQGLSSWGVPSTVDFKRAIAPKDISNFVQDSTSRNSVVLATRIKFKATPT